MITEIIASTDENVNTGRNAGNIASKDFEACVAKSVITFDVGECCTVGTKVLQKPRQIYMVPRVAINGATPNFVTIRPLTAPMMHQQPAW